MIFFFFFKEKKRLKKYKKNCATAGRCFFFPKEKKVIPRIVKKMDATSRRTPPTVTALGGMKKRLALDYFAPWDRKQGAPVTLNAPPFDFIV